MKTSKKSIKPEKKKRISVQSAKAKGRNAQKWVAKKISELLNLPCGKDCLIASREMGQSGVDIRLVGEAFDRFRYDIEVKNQEKWSVLSWIDQAKSNQKEGRDWLLFMTKNHRPYFVTMDADHFFELMEKLHGKGNRH